MLKPGFITRHRNLLLIILLAVTLALSSNSARRRLEETRTTTAIPVMHTASPVASYIGARADGYLTDLQALQSLCDNTLLDDATREAAAQRLTQLISDREAENALETALSQSSLAPCAAVVSGGSVTIVTEKAEITQEDAVMAMTLAVAHAGVQAEDVRILTAK